VSSRGSSENRSVERGEKESPAKKAPAKKKRTRVLSSSSSGSSSGGDGGIDVTIISGDKFSGSSSGSEDMTDTEIWIVNTEEEEAASHAGGAV
jgi:hypothetical protein